MYWTAGRKIWLILSPIIIVGVGPTIQFFSNLPCDDVCDVAFLIIPLWFIIPSLWIIDLIFIAINKKYPKAIQFISRILRDIFAFILLVSLVLLGHLFFPPGYVFGEDEFLTIFIPFFLPALIAMVSLHRLIRYFVRTQQQNKI